jgi:RNA polymerase sigma-70 factor (ECF subfamily)
MEPPRDEINDEALVDSAASGNTSAFTELFNRYYSMIHAFAYRISLSGADADDIAQETFIKAARALGTFRREASFKNWLYRIAVNATEDFRRQNARRSRLAGELEASSREIERPADHARLTDALSALPDDLRQAIVLVYFERLNHAEAARVLGCAEATVSWRVFQGKRRLRKTLESSLQVVDGGAL